MHPIETFRRAGNTNAISKLQTNNFRIDKLRNVRIKVKVKKIIFLDQKIY